MLSSTRRLITTAAIALVAGATALPTAGAGIRPDDRGGPLGVGAVTDRSTPTRPDDRAAERGPGAFYKSPVHVVAREAFEWEDAAVGAATTLAAVLFAGTAALTFRRRERRLAH